MKTNQVAKAETLISHTPPQGNKQCNPFITYRLGQPELIAMTYQIFMQICTATATQSIVDGGS